MENVRMASLKSLIRDLRFIIFGYVCLYFYQMHESNYGSPMLITGVIAALIIIIHVFPIEKEENKRIYENKKAIIPFIIVNILLLAIIFSFNTLLNLNNSTVHNFNRSHILMLQLAISLTIFICYFFKIDLKSFNWHMSIRSFILLAILCMTYGLILNYNRIFNPTSNPWNIFNPGLILNFIIKIIRQSLYPGFYEEVLVRGFLISGLKGFGLSDDNCNILQAIIFGIWHVIGWGTASWMILLSTAWQAMMGYVFGKLYFKTKSLLPCILFHGFVNAL